MASQEESCLHGVGRMTGGTISKHLNSCGHTVKNMLSMGRELKGLVSEE